MEFLARVNPKYLAVASLFAAKQDVRYYLQGVMIEPHPKGGVILCGTNGHVLGVLHDPQGYAKHRIIMSTPSPQLLRALKLKRHMRDFVPKNCWIAARCATVTFGDPRNRTGAEEPPELFGENTIVTVKSELIEGKYPEIAKAPFVPSDTIAQVYDQKAGPMPVFQTPVLQPFLDAATLLSGGRYPTLQIIYRGENGGAVIRTSSEANFFGIAMPTRDAQPDRLLPEFFEAMRTA